MLRRSGEGVVDDFSKRGSLPLSDVSCFVGDFVGDRRVVIYKILR